ncbi:DUF998 domain-containing protein [Luteimonas terricola]|uniref:Membrane protein n=1 Tax=Luteimonas terricola TaxID=645597 RepID=A0ABQ2EGN1_9GAMM|nr:DUF998 domain-containing protein [Luteimonas terricola]GGK07358.1 membrane protein [Luteimonas terricola]
MRAAGIAAGACFALALAGFGAALEGYGQRLHPVALLGATGLPRATPFNLLAFVVPGLLAAFVTMRRRGALPASSLLSARLGWTLALLSALAFAAQGLLPLDPVEPDAGRGRLHGVAWGLWAIAFAAAALALSVAGLAARRPRAAACHFAAGVLVFALAWLLGDAVPVALAQRAAFASWFAWLAWAGWGMSR